MAFSSSPALLLMCGLPGSGKTTTARRLAAERNALRLSPDAAMSVHGFDGYDKAARARIEAEQWALAQGILREGRTVILENGFWGRAERAAYRDRARGLGARVELHFLDVPMEELARRLRQRNERLPQGSFAVVLDDLHTWSAAFEVPDAAELATFDLSAAAAEHPFPAEVRPLLADLSADVLACLGREVQGLYVFGSLVTGDFHPEVSDVDVVVVTAGQATPRDVDRLAGMAPRLVTAHPDWDDRIKMIFVSKSALTSFQHRRSLLACVSPGESFQVEDAGREWLLNWHVLREHGCALLGPAPAAFVPPISRAEVRAEAWERLAAWPERLRSDAKPGLLAYAVLTAARSWHTYATGTVHSKRESAAWVRHRMPEYAGLLDLAWAVRAARGAGRLPQAEVARFVDSVIERARPPVT